MEDSVLYEKHKAAAAAALATFSRDAMGEPELVKEFEEKLHKGTVGLLECLLCLRPRD